MPVEERVVIKIDIDADLAADSAKMTAFFTSMRTQAKLLERDLDKLERRQAGISKRFDKTEKSGNKLTKMFNRMSKTLKGLGKAASKFISLFFKFSFIASAIEIGLVGAALLSVKLIMAGSRFTMQAYNAALVGIGVAAGGAAVAIGSVAAAMQQMQEVQLAPWIGGVRNASIALRNTFNDDMLSFFGMEGLQGAVTALGRGGVDASQGYTSILRSLGDYTPDPKELTELAKVYAEIQRSGIVGDSAFSSLNKINPTLTAGMGEIMGLDSEALGKAAGAGGIDASVFESVLAGDATATDGFEGQLERLSMTVVGQLKGMLPRIFGQFAELGRPFLQTIWETLVKVEDIVERTIFRIRKTVTNFGLDSMIPGIVDAFQSLNDIFVKLVNESLPKVEGWFSRFTGWWNTFRGLFRQIGNIFGPLEEGADILWDTLKNMLGPFFTGFGSLVTGLNTLLIDNKQAFLDFGTAFGGVFEAIMNWFQGANEGFAEALPVWTNLLNVIADDVVPALGDLFEMFHEASLVALPAVATALSVIASAVSQVAGAISGLLSIPGIGVLLSLALMPRMLGGGLARGIIGAGAGAAGRGLGLLPAAGGAGAAGLGAASLTGIANAGSSGMMVGGVGTLATGLTVGGIGAAAGGAGAVLGTLAGDRIQGAGGILAGAGGGAATGAGIGAGIGAIFGGVGAGPGAVIGGAIGGIAGGVSSWLAQGRQKKQLEEAGQAIAEEIALEAAEAAETQKIVEFAGAAGQLAKLTGESTADIMNLASALHVDLGGAVTSTVEAMKQLGMISESDFTLTGSQDISNQAFMDGIFGGEFFQKTFVAPDEANSANAALQEISSLKRAGRDIPPDLVRQFIEADAAYRQVEYGNSGGELVNGLLNDARGIDETYGLDGLIQALAADAQQGLKDRLDPTKATDMTALLGAIDDSLSGLEFANKGEQTAAAQTIFDEKRAVLEDMVVTAPQLVDEEIQKLIAGYTATDLATKQQTLADSLVILNDAALTTAATLAGDIVPQGPPAPPTPAPSGRQPFAAHSGKAQSRPSPTRTSARNARGGRGAGKTVLNNRTQVRANANVSINVGLDTAVRQLNTQIAREVRNQLSRGNRYNNGNIPEGIG